MASCLLPSTRSQAMTRLLLSTLLVLAVSSSLLHSCQARPQSARKWISQSHNGHHWQPGESLGCPQACTDRLRRAYPLPAKEPTYTRSRLVPILSTKVTELVSEVQASATCQISEETFGEMMTYGSLYASSDVTVADASDVLARMAFLERARKVHLTDMSEDDREVFRRMLAAPIMPEAKALFYLESYDGVGEDAALPPLEYLDAGSCVAYAPGRIGCMPSSINVGVMKGATGELRLWMSKHPQVHVWQADGPIHPREGHFFDYLSPHVRGLSREDLEKELRKKLVPDYLRYGLTLDNLTEVETHITYEKTPKYCMMDEHHLWAIRHVMPTARLILSLRQPTLQAYSHFQMLCEFGHVYYINTTAAALPYDIARLPMIAVPTMPREKRPAAFKRLLGQVLSQEQLNGIVFERAPYPCPPRDLTDYLTRAMDVKEHKAAAPSNETQRFIQQLSTQTWTRMLSRVWYDEAITRLLRVFPAEQLYVTLMEKLFADFIGTMDEIQRWLRLPVFDFNDIAFVNENGYTVLKGTESKSFKKPYDKLPPDFKQRLDAKLQPVVDAVLQHSFVRKELIDKFWR